MQEGEKVQGEIQKVITTDPTIRDGDRIIVSVEKKSLWKGGGEFVLLKGKLHTAEDKDKVEKIARLHAAGREVVDQINVVG
jgi:hypothetical protein